MTHDELMLFLGVDELYTVTRDHLSASPDAVFEKIDAGYSPVLIVADDEPDLLMFSWEDYKRRFSMLYPPEEFERIEEALKRYEEAQ